MFFYAVKPVHGFVPGTEIVVQASAIRAVSLGEPGRLEQGRLDTIGRQQAEEFPRPALPVNGVAAANQSG